MNNDFNSKKANSSDSLNNDTMVSNFCYEPKDKY